MLIQRYIQKQLSHLPDSLRPGLPTVESVLFLATTGRVVFMGTTLFQASDPFVTDLYPTQDQTASSKERLLHIASSLANLRQEPIFRALRHKALSEKLPLREVEVDQSSPNGIIGRLDRSWYVLGDERFVQEQGYELGLTSQTLSRQLEEQGQSLLFVAQRYPKRLLGLIATDRQFLPEAAATMHQIDRLNIEHILLTSLKTRPAKGVAQRLGFSLFHSELQPIEKRMVNESLQDAPFPTLCLLRPDQADLAPQRGQVCWYCPAGSVLSPAHTGLLLERLEDLPVLIEQARAILHKAQRRYFWCKL